MIGEIVVAVFVVLMLGAIAFLAGPMLIGVFCESLDEWRELFEERKEMGANQCKHGEIEALRDFAAWVGRSIFEDELDGFFCEAACRKLYKLGMVSKNEDNWVAGPEIVKKSREMNGDTPETGV